MPVIIPPTPVKYKNLSILEKIINSGDYFDILKSVPTITFNSGAIFGDDELQKEYVNENIKDFTTYFLSIDEKNINEITTPNTYDYNKRKAQIKDFKKLFIYLSNNIKRQKGTVEYIEFIIDFYVRMKNYTQVQYTPLSNPSYLLPNKRYRMTKKDTLTINNLSVGNIFNNNSVIQIPVGCEFVEEFTLKIEVINQNSYSIQSVITVEEWDTIIKPLVNPIGYNVDYNNINIITSSDDYVYISKETINVNLCGMNINKSFNNKNLNLQNSIDSIDNIRNLSLKDLFSINKQKIILSKIY